MWNAVIADAIALLHAAYVGFVILGQGAIVLGLVRKWHWVRNPWFRTIHLVAIGIVVGEAVLDIPCAIFSWENSFRMAAGQAPVGASFISRWVYFLLMIELPQWAFELGNVCFGVLVLTTFVCAPPRWRRASHGRENNKSEGAQVELL